jgi:hypothetical protein
VDPAPRKWSWPWCRPGAATSPSRRTWPRKSPASAATRPRRRTCRTRSCRPTALAAQGPRRHSRDARGAGSDRGRDPRPGLAPRTRRGCSGRTTTRTGPGNPGPGSRDDDRRHQPALSQHSVLRRHLVASLLDVLALNERQGREDVAIFEIGKGYGRVRGRQAARVDRLAFLLAGNAEPPAGTAGPPVRPRRRQGHRRVAVPAAGPAGADLRPDERGLPVPSGPSARRPAAVRAPRRSAAAWPSCTRTPSPSGTCGPARHRRRAGDPRPRAATPLPSTSSRSAASRRSSAIWRSSSASRDGGRGGGLDPPPRRRPCCGRAAVRPVSRRAAGCRREEPGLPPRLRANDRTLTEAEVDAAMAAVRAGLERADLGAHIRS